MNDSLFVAGTVDALVHSQLETPFNLAKARLYVVPDTLDVCITNENLILLDEDENPYRLLLRTRHHESVQAGCLVVTGWAAPFDDPDDGLNTASQRPSQHPKRERVRIAVAITHEGMSTVMRRSEKPEIVQPMADRGLGELPDVLEQWWDGTLE